MNKPLFSIALIARNEEHTIPRMVASLKEFQERGGEILLCDTGSTDKTVEVAKSLGCKVHEVGDKFRITIDEDLANKINSKFVADGEAPVVNAGESLFDFASARNYIVQFAENDMISTMDCDEIFTKLDIDKLNQCITDGYEQFEYNFVFSHDGLGNPVIKFRQSKFYDRKKVKWVGIIHEVLQGPANILYLGEEFVKLEHYQNEKTNRTGYLKGLAVDCYNNPNNDRNSHYFAREMLYTGRPKSAIKEFENHVSMNRWPTEASQSMMYIGDCYKLLGDIGKAFEWWAKSFEKEPRREPMMRFAEYYYFKNMHQQVVAYCEAALTVTQLPFYSNHQPYYEHVPHELLYISYWWLGKKEKSEEHWKIALSYCPTNRKYIEDGEFYKVSGERFIPGVIKRPTIVAEHYARYNFAAKYTKDKVVLDAACGTGYGKDILKSKEYYGVDISPEVDCIIQDLENGVDLNIKPDVVVSFETIEHLENPTKFLQWVKDNAKQFVFSIPISLPSEFHKQVYTVEEIKALIGKFFPVVEYYGQTLAQITKDQVNPKYIVGVAYVEELPKVSFVLPTMGTRPKGLERCLNSIKSLNYPQEKIEVLIEHDSVENRIGVPKLVKQGVEKSTGEWVVFASDDTEFTPDSILESLKVGDRGFVSFNTGPLSFDKGNRCEHFMIRKDVIAEIGEVFDTEFFHLGVDNLLAAKMDRLGIFVRAENAIVNHYHFSKEGGATDATYNLGWSHAEEDRALLAKKLALLYN